MQLNKKIYIPEPILLDIQKRFDNFKGSQKSKGYITVLNMLKTSRTTLGNLKKIKNTIENVESPELSFLLKDNNFIKWYEHTLSRESDRLKTHKANKERAGFNNAHRKAHEKNSSIIPESLNVRVFINENIYNKIK